MSQTSPLSSVAANPFVTVDGFAPGYTRNNTGSSEAAIVYGGRMVAGRVVVTTPRHNLKNPLQQRRACESAMLPDCSGDYTIDALNGALLSDPQNAALLKASQVDGEFCVLGISTSVNDCENCDCSECKGSVDPCPRGNPDPHFSQAVGRMGSTFVYATHGAHVGVRTSVDLKKGDLLDLVCAPATAADPDCLVTLGNVTLRGSGYQPLPDSWKVTGAAKAGEFVEIYMGEPA